MQRFDIFGKSVPSFNLGGDSYIKSAYGGTMTVFIFLIMITYASVKLQQLISKHNPNISEYTQHDFYDQNDFISFDEADFKLAVTIEGVFDAE